MPAPPPEPLNAAVVARFRAAQTPAELAELFVPTRRAARAELEDVERTLRALLGDAAYDRLAKLAHKSRSAKRSGDGPNVVVLPGVMGSELSVGDAGNQWKLWVSYWWIYRGWLRVLKLDPSGTAPAGDAAQVAATGLLHEYYADLVLTLGETCNVRAFPYDWRLPLSRSADALHGFIRAHFPSRKAILVAHSMGGLVSRALMGRAPAPNESNPVERLVMLGTPNYGSFEVPLILAGIQSTVKDLVRLTSGAGGFVSSAKKQAAKIELFHLLDTFPALYEMLPVDDVPGFGPSAMRRQLYNPDVYKSFNDSVSRVHFQNAQVFQRSIAGVIDPARMAYVAGYNQETVSGVLDPNNLDVYESYEVTLAGDGKVPHSLGLLAGVPTYFVDCPHADLAMNDLVLREIDNLVQGKPVQLPTTMPVLARSLEDVRKLSRDWALRQAKRDRDDDEQMQVELGALARSERGVEATAEPEPTEAALALERKLVASIFGEHPAAPRPAAPTTAARKPARTLLPALRIRLIYGNIATCHESDEPDPLDSFDLARKVKKPWRLRPLRPFTVPKDAIAVGKYLGVRPFYALNDLDRRISAHVNPHDPNRLYLQELIDRGLLRGDLGVPTLLPDPRAAGSTKRDIVFAGMGSVGQFGEPEARLVSRELVWFLGQSGKKHLATILLGAGTGNLVARDALRAFLDGTVQALRSEPRADLRIETITFVEYYGFRIREIDAALRDEAERHATDVQLDYAPYTYDELRAIDERDEQRVLEDRKRTKPTEDQPEMPVRVVAELSQNQYWFSALSNTASIPQRASSLDPRIVQLTNDGLVRANSPAQQMESGTALGKMLVHADLRRVLRSNVPIVMEVDSDTARIHWEMVYRLTNVDQDVGDFLGLERGFTRQLRTRFAPPPAPAVKRRPVLRALVVADPAADAPLDGARREAEEIVRLFEQFNEIHLRAATGFRIEFTALIGPGQATQAVAMQKLITFEYDILHYAGHCFFDAEKPSTCGWIFALNRDGAKKPELISVPELLALDSVPPFVFSNACESGITPERRGDRAAGLTPAFAEAFFERGVRDFVCTAWPVGDAAALVFARTFYAKMLGLKLDPAYDQPAVTGIEPPDELVHAMRAARVATLRSGSGLTTWGAYQHYGNPYTRFFEINAAVLSKPIARKTAAVTANDFDQVERVVARYAAQLRSIPGVADVRAGYRFVDGWITDEPAVVVAVLDKNARPIDDHRLPRSLEGVVVDIVPATPQEQLRALDPAERRRLGLPPALDELLDDTRKPSNRLKYPKDKKVLKAFDDSMTVNCHVSPEAGWPALEKFLTGPIAELTVAMYDFTAPHIRDRILEALGDAGKLTLVLCPSSGGAVSAEGDRGVKDNDFDEDALKKELQEKLGDRLSFAWAAVPIAGKTTSGYFPRAYHIKVAVKKAAGGTRAFWLSSGNWQSSNQPSPADFPPDETRKTSWRKYNREWNVVIDHPGLAGVFLKTIERDFTMASKLQAGTRGGKPDPSRMPSLFVPMDPDDYRGDVAVTKLAPLELTAKVKVQPLLTPDNYVDFVLPLIEGAKTKLYFINQSLAVHDLKLKDDSTVDDSTVFGKLVNALLDKAKALKEMKIILRDISGVDKELSAMKRLGFPMEKVKVQPALHTKGIVVDGKRVLIGSQNWTFQGVDANRDASLLFDNPKIAEYFETSFLHDWEKLARSKVASLTNPPRLLLDADTRSTGVVSGGVVTWRDYFGM